LEGAAFRGALMSTTTNNLYFSGMRLLMTIVALISLVNYSFGQLIVEQELHHYAIDDLENYQQSVSIVGQNTSLTEEQLGFLVNENAELLSYQLYQRKGNKWKPSKLRREMTVSSIDRSAFFTGTKYYYFPIPEGMEFKLEFSTQEKHTIFLTKLYKKGWFDGDWVDYKFELPDDLQLTTRSGQVFDGNFHINSEVFKDSISMPYLIHPKEEEPIAYFSKWFGDRINPQMELDESMVPEELIQISRTRSRLELAEACFQFVQREIKYIDIENGINAIIPRNCEKVLKNGLGDCKDMATLLTALYRHFGFEAYPAISRTNSKKDTFNFPSLGLANHTVCALWFFDEWYFLDATEDACLFGDASLQIFDTEAFVVGHEDNPFVKVEAQPRSESWLLCTYSIDESMNLEMQLQAYGKMNQLFYHLQLKENEPSQAIESIFQRAFEREWKVEHTEIVNDFSSIKVVTPLSTSMYSKMGSKTLYNLDFLPNLSSLLSLLQNSRHLLYDTKVSIFLEFDGEISNLPEAIPESKLFIKESEDGLLIECEVDRSEDDSPFRDTELALAWKEFVSKPLLVNYE
jgi:hypothetical protein